MCQKSFLKYSRMACVQAGDGPGLYYNNIQCMADITMLGPNYTAEKCTK